MFRTDAIEATEVTVSEVALVQAIGFKRMSALIGIEWCAQGDDSASDCGTGLRNAQIRL